MTLFLSEQFKEIWKNKNPFEEVEKLQGEVFRELAGRKTLRFTLVGKNYFIKIHHGVGLLEIFKNLLCLRLPVLGAANEFAAIQRLQALGLETMKVAGYGRRGWNPASQKSFIITEELMRTISLEDYCESWREHKPGFRMKYILIKKVADISRCMHDNGINHRDFYICHFLLDLSSLKHPDSVTLFLIDLHRAQVRRKTPFRWRLKDIASLYFSVMDLGFTQRDFFRFMRFYSGKPLKECIADQDGFWRGVELQGRKLWQRKLRKGDAI